MVEVYELQSVWYEKIFPKIQLEIPFILEFAVTNSNSSALLGTVIKSPKGTGSAWETLNHEKLYFWQSIYLQCSLLFLAIGQKARLIEIPNT